MSRRNPGPVPDRWLKCPRKANYLIVDKFLAFKTPLCKAFNDQVEPQYRFTPQMLFEICKQRRIQLGLWIDLTNTTRFYDREEVEQEDCVYQKIDCRGHGQTPSPDQTIQFCRTVQRFIQNNPLKSIGVHCTHGFNRTGFMIVSFLVKMMDFSLDHALGTFANARPDGIYKPDYVSELYSRYDSIEDMPAPPNKPDWCYEGDEDEASPTNSTTSSNQNYKSEKLRENAKFMEGVPNVDLFLEKPKASQLQKIVQQMCGWRTRGFPGSQPVSMNKRNIQFLGQKPYQVSWKADGMRYMMLIDGEDEVYFFDRDFNVFHVNGLRFPSRRDPDKHLRGTLLDGEMVIDKVNGTDIPRYLAYDIVSLDGRDVKNLPFFPTRLGCIADEIIKPRTRAMETRQIIKEHEPFSIRKKDFWDITQAGNLLGEKFARALAHEPDGLIFQPSKDPYVPGRCDNVLKWKPPSLNSVDFRMKIVTEKGMGKVPKKLCLLYVGQLSTAFGKMDYKSFLKEYENKIVECMFEDGKWKFMRERTDKSFPNSFETAVAVMDSIENPIAKEDLLGFISTIKFDQVMMPPPRPAIRR